MKTRGTKKQQRWKRKISKMMNDVTEAASIQGKSFKTFTNRNNNNSGTKVFFSSVAFVYIYILSLCLFYVMVGRSRLIDFASVWAPEYGYIRARPQFLSHLLLRQSNAPEDLTMSFRTVG